MAMRMGYGLFDGLTGPFLHSILLLSNAHFMRVSSSGFCRPFFHALRSRLRGKPNHLQLHTLPVKGGKHVWGVSYAHARIQTLVSRRSSAHARIQTLVCGFASRAARQALLPPAGGIPVSRLDSGVGWGINSRWGLNT